MIHIFLSFWVISALFIIREKKIVRLIIHLGIFSLISSVCFLLFAAPDVAMAEAVVSGFSTIIFIVCFEKYYSLVDASEISEKTVSGSLPSRIFPVCFTLLLAVLFIWCIPDNTTSTYLKDQYISKFLHDVGGENAVTAIYLGYRMYDTMFEALMLLCSIVAVVHLSWYEETHVTEGKPSDIRESDIANITIRIICPILLLFSVYLIVNGSISPGGGFQGGVVIASFFVCRYMIHDIFDMRIDKVIKLEKLVYIGIIVLSVYFIVMGAEVVYLPISKNMYLIIMNLLVGLKVACGFIIVFYRFIVFERREEM